MQVAFLRLNLFGLHLFHSNFQSTKHVKGNSLEFGPALAETLRSSGVLWSEGGTVDEVVQGPRYED